MRKFHAGQCQYNMEMLPSDCDCGATRPATVSWAETEVSAARYGVERANERLAIAEARLREMAARGA